MDPVASLDVDDVVVFQDAAWYVAFPCTAAWVFRLELLKGLYIWQISRLKSHINTNRPPAGVSLKYMYSLAVAQLA
jgi:hypothetical protein